MSPVLLAALECARFPASELVHLLATNCRRITVGPEHPASAGLLSAVPAGSTIDATNSEIDFATPQDVNGSEFVYYEAHTLPCLTLAGATLPETVVATLPGRRLTTIVSGLFKALQIVDPVIETARVSTSSNGQSSLELTLTMDWVSIFAL